MNLICLVSGHEVSDIPWRYAKEGDCTQECICRRCHAPYKTRTVHEDPTDWKFIKEKACEQEGTCPRCSQKQHKMAHVFDKCTCTRCGFEYHDWVSDRCERCAGEGRVEVQDYYSYWWEPCRDCGGTGAVNQHCSKCGVYNTDS